MAKKRRLRKTGGLAQSAPQETVAPSPAPKKVEEVVIKPAPTEEEPKPTKRRSLFGKKDD